jgi:hypothetical protein
MIYNRRGDLIFWLAKTLHICNVFAKWISRGVVTAVDKVEKPQPGGAGCGYPSARLTRDAALVEDFASCFSV